MFTANLDKMLEQAMAHLGILAPGNAKEAKSKGQGGKPGNDKLIANISPSKALVITGLLTDALKPISVLVDRDQTVQIVLEGSLRRKTELDKMMEELGQMPFEDVMKALLENFG